MLNEAMTQAEFEEALPKDRRKSVNKLLMVKINNILTDPEEAQLFKDNLLTYTHILSTGRYKITDYVNAVRYVGFKMMNYTNKDSYAKTFPDKMQRFHRENVSDKSVSAYVYAYNNNQLVNQIYEQALIPVYLVNAPALQKMINVCVDIATNDKVAPMARVAAASSVMANIKFPEVKKVDVNIQDNRMSIMDELGSVTETLARKQQESIVEGVFTSKQIAQATIIEPNEDA